MSFLLAVDVIVGAVALGQLTVVQVTDLLPVASWAKIMMKLLPATAVGIVSVAFAVSVRSCTVPFARLIVSAVLVLAVYSVST